MKWFQDWTLATAMDQLYAKQVYDDMKPYINTLLPHTSSYGRAKLALLSLGVAFYVFIIGLSLLGLYIRSKPSPKSSRLPPTEAPPVSILRPLKGVDLNLYQNLESTFKQRYPIFELIFSIAEAQDPARQVVEQLMTKYPNVDARLIIGEKIVGSNPKINNLIRSYETAKYDIVWICDSNVFVDVDTLGRSVDALTSPGVGVVHHLPLAVLPSSYGAEVEQVFLDTNHAKMYIAINYVAVSSCVMGKSNLYRRSDLDKAGGLAAFANFMAEDNLVADAIWKQGLSHVMTCDTACQSIGYMSPREYLMRRSRWLRVRKYIVTAATLVEPFQECVLTGIYGAASFHALWPNINPWRFLTTHFILWFCIDYTLFHTFLASQSMQHPNKTMPFHKFLRAWITREVCALPIWCYAMAGTRIRWRGSYYRLRMDGSGVPYVERPLKKWVKGSGKKLVEYIGSPILNGNSSTNTS
ncbi:hypothetical protein BZG36_04233 [Bifiguratus adelaidae]|uniref:Ceramide glucosyltransferase n=1 Tax=Bifiguratus adelaidae TaxID=1938954 RepID=A0A261Y0T3_9FUNG|nr:hypothetical protein BZG36_04233 [Bifiguratus adelaidae]